MRGQLFVLTISRLRAQILSQAVPPVEAGTFADQVLRLTK